MRTPLLSPALLFPLLWVLVVSAAQLSGLDFFPLSRLFYLYLAGAIGSFSAAAVLGATAARRLRLVGNLYSHVHDLALSLTPQRLVCLHVAVMATSLFFQCLDHRAIAGSGWWRPEGLIAYRISVGELGIAANYRFTAIFNYFFFAAAPLLWLQWRRVTPAVRWGAVACLVTYIYLSTARASFFTIFLLLGFFILHFRPKIYLVAGGALVLFFSFQLLGSIVGKSDFSAFWIYLFAPVYALDQILNGMRTDLPGLYYSFRFFQPILSALGFMHPPQTYYLAYYSTPFRTNVYTMFGPFVLDFGIAGSIVCVTVFGFASGVVRGLQLRFRRVPYLAFLSSLSLTLLALSAFYDYYTSAGYVWFSILFSTFLFPRNSAPVLEATRARLRSEDL